MTARSIQDDFRAQVRATVERHNLLPRRTSTRQRREPVIVGVSGGPDSAALLHILARLARKDMAIRPVAAHLHHGLRGSAADVDQRFVQRLAADLGCVCVVGRADVLRKARRLHIGTEEAGRLARRQFLARVARDQGATKVALAHQADDRAETVLFHILRGTGVEGLAALGPRAPLLPEEDVEIVRPLIEVPRRFILGYLADVGQAYREDETNRADAHTRNRLRHELLPLLRRQYNPKVDEALLRLSDQAAAAGEVLADALDEVWRQIVREVPAPGDVRGGSPDPPRSGPPSVVAEIVIDADDFEPLRPWMQGAILRRAIDRLGGGLKYMSMQRTREAVAALLSKTVAGPVDLPGNLLAERRRRTIRIGKGSAECGVRSVE
jgi:tRNA(Ile)-lysidine synthase